jgi:putative hydrolase of the HAD superfamily
VVLFDLGNVLIECGSYSKMLEWQSWTKKLSKLEEKWSESFAMQEYQRGAISTKEFVTTIIDELDLTVNVARFIREFRLIPKGFYPGTELILKELGKKYITACLSNTNELHWNKLCSVDKIEKQFTRCFPSHLIHELKPEKDSYLYVIKALGVTPSKIVFFDDRGENVDAAKELGINAFKTENFEEVCFQLKELDIL